MDSLIRSLRVIGCLRNVKEDRRHEELWKLHRKKLKLLESVVKAWLILEVSICEHYYGFLQNIKEKQMLL